MILIRLLNPFVPHISEEIWQNLHSSNNNTILAQKTWPQYDPELVKDDSYTIAIQINGKLRDTFEFNNEASEDYIKQTVCKLDSVEKHLVGKKIAKIIIVPKKIINIVAVA